MLGDRHHGVVGVPSRVIGMALAELVDRIHMKMRGQIIKNGSPIIGIVGHRTEVASVDQHHGFSTSPFKISGSDSIDVHKLDLIDCCCVRRRRAQEKQNSHAGDRMCKRNPSQ
jgi:hypothetical protein